MNPEITLTWNILEEAFEIVNISSITVNPQDAIATYKSADDPNQEGDNEIPDEVWVDYTPPLPYVKNTTRNLQFNESQFLASPGEEIGVTTYVTTSDGYTWAAMSTAINAMWPYDATDYSGIASQSPYYAGNIVITPPEGVVKVTANYKGQNMKFWANEDGLTSDNPEAIKLDRYFVIDEWGNEYIMHASGQLEQSQVATAFEEAILPEGWTKETRQLSEDLILTPAEGADGSFHYLVFRDSADNTYHQTKWSDTGSLSAQIEDFPIWGGQDDNILSGDVNGEIRDDLIHGAGGNDTIIPGLGNDEIWGDADIDTVILTGDSSDYSIEEISSEEINTFTVSGFGYTKTLYDVENLQFDNETISLNNNDSLLNTQIYRFRTGEGTYLYVADEERQAILANNYNFVEEGGVFQVSMEMEDDLIPIYRFRNTNVTGAYLYVEEEERQAILQGDYGFAEEGLAFYTYGAMSEQGQEIYRFQTNPGSYIFVEEEERQNILQNYSSFTEEGIAFNVA
ncbi:hypothetical protein [Cyanobacterium aponinum]|uniref:DUF5648 domain-containing protein n=1 Tax=Cyanobacterium aponinum 0216 TaxID=2676140 RepID=A0A844GV77_9CHRO|nr:hypothetical protein [Cyanobacterium aponinum]MTF40374.1 hypothetical protein [Cyanobacterium aponinum 0216]